MGTNRVFSSSSPALKMGLGSRVALAGMASADGGGGGGRVGGVVLCREEAQSEHSHFPLGFSNRGGEWQTM